MYVFHSMTCSEVVTSCEIQGVTTVTLRLCVGTCLPVSTGLKVPVASSCVVIYEFFSHDTDLIPGLWNF